MEKETQHEMSLKDSFKKEQKISDVIISRDDISAKRVLIPVTIKSGENEMLLDLPLHLTVEAKRGNFIQSRINGELSFNAAAFAKLANQAVSIKLAPLPYSEYTAKSIPVMALIHNADKTIVFTAPARISIEDIARVQRGEDAAKAKTAAQKSKEAAMLALAAMLAEDAINENAD